MQFSIDLCLEEALANVIQHGYGGSEQCSVVVTFANPRARYFEFVIEDEAPAFNPCWRRPNRPRSTPLNQYVWAGRAFD